MNVESLAYLTAKSINPLAAYGRCSVADKFNFAGLLSGLSDDEVNFALAKYAGDESSSILVVLSVRHHALVIANKKTWRIKEYQIKALADIAVIESLNPCRCKRCGGIGHIFNNICLSCKGTGFRHASGHEMARQVGIVETAFRKDWMEKLCAVSEIIFGWDSSIRQHVFSNGK